MGNTNSIKSSCANLGIDLNADRCVIEFNHSTGHVIKFGDIERGGLPADTDIAGLGVLLASVIPGGLLIIFGMVFAVARCCHMRGFEKKKLLKLPTIEDDSYKKIHKHADDVITSLSATQLLVVLAFGIAFYAKAECSISTYHYVIVIHLAIAGLAASVLALLLVQITRERIYKTGVQYLLLGICLGFLIYQRDVNIKSAIRNQLPTPAQVDSVVVLPAFCLLNSDLAKFTTLTDKEERHLTGDLPRYAVVQSIVLAAFGLLIFFKHVYELCSQQHKRRTSGKPQRPESYTSGKTINWFKFIVWVFCSLSMVWNWVLVFLLHKWAGESGWIQLEDNSNPEQGISSLGQIGPLVAVIGVIGFTAIETFLRVVYGEKVAGGNGPAKPRDYRLHTMNGGHPRMNGYMRV